MGKLGWLIMGLGLTVSGWLQAVPVKPDAPQTYKVKKGDTLWDIAKMYLDQPWSWPELWRRNTDIENPHLIYPGDVLKLSRDEQGEPVLTLEAKPEYVLSPEGEKIRKSRPVPVIESSIIAPFIADMLVLDEKTYQAQPRVLGDYNGQVMYASDDLLLTEAYEQSDSDLVVRRQGPLKNMQGEILAIQGRAIARAAKVDKASDKHHLIRVSQTNYETVQGDRVVPAHWLPGNEDLPLMPAPDDITGFVIDNFQSHRLMGKYDVVVLDLGQSHLSPGMVMGLYNEGETVDASDPKPKYLVGGQQWLTEDDNVHQGPALKVGELIVFQVFERVSFGLILKADDFIQRGTRVGRP